jgi:hypothetical protein
LNTKTINGELLARMFRQASTKLNQQREHVDALNVFPVPDGDTGTNMSLTMKSATADIANQEFETVEEVAKRVSKGSLMGARGNSGVILSQIFRGFYKGCSGKVELNSDDFADALKLAAVTSYKAVLKPVEGTILTVIRETGDYALTLKEKELTIAAFLDLVIAQSEKTLSETPKHLEALRQAKVVDAGGMGLVYILKGFKEALHLTDSSESHSAVSHEPDFVTGDKPVFEGLSTTDIHFGYCTEFIVRGKDLEDCPLKEDIVHMGDSMVYVPDDDLVKVHIHTNDPGLVLQKALQYGELLHIKIENMREQHQHVLVEQSQIPVSEEIVENRPFAFIAVAIGDGIEAIFKDLKVDHIIQGGQTMNPSTEDFHLAIDKSSADSVFLFPNNSNIILAANQAKQLTHKNVYVLPTKTIPQGISAMLAFNPGISAEENYEEMLKAIHKVKTVQVTYAVRDTSMGDIVITKDDILGIVDGEIVASEKTIEETVDLALKDAMDSAYEIATLYYGADVTEEEASMMKDKIASDYPDLEVEAYPGGQPLYYYIIALE